MVIILDWEKFPNVKKLFDRIMEHRKDCPDWKAGKPCFNCHFGSLGLVEQDLEPYI